MTCEREAPVEQKTPKPKVGLMGGLEKKLRLSRPASDLIASVLSPRGLDP